MLLLTMDGNFSELHDFFNQNNIYPALVENENNEWRFYFNTQEELDTANSLVLKFNDFLNKKRLDDLNEDYSQRLKKIENCFTKPDMLLTGTPNATKIETIQAQLRLQYQSTHAEMITKQGVILNG